MKKILSLCLALTFPMNISGYAISSNCSQTQNTNVSAQKKKTKNLDSNLAVKIGAGVAAGTALILAAIHFWPKNSTNNHQQTANDSTSEDPNPVYVSDLTTDNLEYFAIQWLREDLSSRFGDHPCIKHNDLTWVSPLMRNVLFNVRFAAIKHAYLESVSLIFMEHYEAERCLDNIKQGLDNKYANICRSYSLSERSDSEFEDLFNRIMADNSWHADSYKKGYLEMFKLYTVLKNEIESIYKGDHSRIAGFMVTENRSRGKNELASYDVSIVKCEELGIN